MSVSRSSLRVTLAQQPLVWEDVSANLRHFTEELRGLEGKTDVVILPEMFTTGFSMNAQALAETMEGEAIDWLTKTAAKINAVVTGSFICKDKEVIYNRLIWMFPDGQYQYYDKRHLFAYAGEHEAYTAGDKHLLVEYLGWKICPMICYDLRFPVWARYSEQLNYDVLIYIANWPKPRRKHWQQLLIARAIENQAFVIGVNRVGEDEKGLLYAGDSAVIDPMGETLYQASYQPGIHTSILSYSQVQTIRGKFRFLDDRDNFQL